MSNPVTILSLGAGVQSSTLALMDKEGELSPRVDFAVFADTGDEPQSVYQWLDELSTLVDFPIHIAKSKAGKLSDNILQWGFSQIPAFRVGENGKVEMGRRQCTNHWKIRPITRKIREVTQTKHKHLDDGHFKVLKGISIDEASRAAPSREAGQEAVFPLFDKMLTRSGCVKWLTSHGYKEPPKSACVFCPLRSDRQWKESQEAGGKEWDLIVAVDRTLNARGEFLHRSARKIDEVEFGKPTNERQINLWEADCGGNCGV